MKKILFFRSAKWSVIDLLVKQFYDSEEIFCLVQRNSVNRMQERYPTVKCYVLPEDFFNYDCFMAAMKDIKMSFDEIYIPISGYRFNGLEEIYNIAEEIEYHTMFLVNGDGEIVSQQKKKKQNLKDKLYNKSIHAEILLFRQIYRIKQRVLSRRI